MAAYVFCIVALWVRYIIHLSLDSDERSCTGKIVNQEKLTLKGKDNYDRPRQEYADKMAKLTDEEFVKFAADAIYWQADACYDEAKRRNKPEMYDQAYKDTLKRAGH